MEAEYEAKNEAEYESRKQELLAECTVAPQVFGRVLSRLEQFMKPFVDHLVRKEQCEHASTFVQGLLSDLEHKNVESIAYRFGQERMPLQWFVGMSDWDHEPLRDELVRQVGEQLGDANGVIVFDPSSPPTKETAQIGKRIGWRRTPMVWPVGQSRQLPGGCYHGICFGQGACLGRYASVSSQGLDAG